VGEWKANSKIIDVLLGKDCTGGNGVMVNRSEHRAMENACQFNILCGRPKKKIGSYVLIEMSADRFPE
jgi:hypothetical protein